jgi:glycosyltransferase involved in cell wall biosynthesis
VAQNAHLGTGCPLRLYIPDMNLLLSDNVRCAVTGDGSLWTPNPSLGYAFWSEYLGVFDEVRPIVRAMYVDEPPSGWSIASGPGVKAIPVPYFVGPWQLAARYRAVRKAIQTALRECEAIHLRLPSTMSQLIWRLLNTGRPYGITITGDPHEALAPGLLSDPSRPFFRRLYSKRLVRQCAGACAISYVTSEALQRNYPPPSGVFATHFTDVNLPPDAWASAPREAREPGGAFKLVMVGSFAHRIKAADALIDAIAMCAGAGMDLTGVIVGEGTYRSELIKRCQALGLNERIEFTGQLPSSEEVRNQLDQADLFVLPSKTEGLPRALLEAMARALPCIATAVGGIPELLPREDLVAPGDVGALARKIQEVAADPQRLARMSARNLDKCGGFRADIIRKRRTQCLRTLRQKTEAWLRERRQG